MPTANCSHLLRYASIPQYSVTGLKFIFLVWRRYLLLKKWMVSITSSIPHVGMAHRSWCNHRDVESDSQEFGKWFIREWLNHNAPCYHHVIVLNWWVDQVKACSIFHVEKWSLWWLLPFVLSFPLFILLNFLPPFLVTLKWFWEVPWFFTCIPSFSLLISMGL